MGEGNLPHCNKKWSEKMTKDEYENNKENMKPWKCMTGHVYMVFKNSCFFCVHSDIFVDYTNGPYLILCDVDCNTEHGMSGQCKQFIELNRRL